MLPEPHCGVFLLAVWQQVRSLKGHARECDRPAHRPDDAALWTRLTFVVMVGASTLQLPLLKHLRYSASVIRCWW